ncbi:hypothetical protein GGS21DRAFT_493501 [Xylaria nigripes]|nr:hypothetical protein GGS21DRAFT_493501 [Xylaria nigripes]
MPSSKPAVTLYCYTLLLRPPAAATPYVRPTVTPYCYAILLRPAITPCCRILFKLRPAIALNTLNNKMRQICSKITSGPRPNYYVPAPDEDHFDSDQEEAILDLGPDAIVIDSVHNVPECPTILADKLLTYPPT